VEAYLVKEQHLLYLELNLPPPVLKQQDKLMKAKNRKKLKPQLNLHKLDQDHKISVFLLLVPHSGKLLLEQVLEKHLRVRPPHLS